MNKNHSMCLILSLFLIHIAHGMDKKIKLSLFTNEDDLPGKMVNFLENKKNEQIAVNSLLISNQRVIKAIAEREDSVTGRIGGHYMTEFNKIPGLKKDITEHGKNFCSKNNCLVSTANASNSIYTHGNKEMMVQVEGDTDLSTTMYKQMTSQSPAKTVKAIINKTPAKNTSFSSRNTELNESRAQRITNLVQRHKKEPKKNTYVNAMVMNLTDKTMANALQESAKNNIRTKLLVNKSSLTKNSTPLLQAIQDAGGDVRVYDPQESKRSILHTKMLLTPQLFILSNANFTPEGDNQNNIETYFPNNKKLIRAAKKNFKKIEKECTPLTESLELHEDKKIIKKATKRKLETAAKNPPAKKKKK